MAICDKKLHPEIIEFERELKRFDEILAPYRSDNLDKFCNDVREAYVRGEINDEEAVEHCFEQAGLYDRASTISREGMKKCLDVLKARRLKYVSESRKR